jgi:hypothetical protein
MVIDPNAGFWKLVNSWDRAQDKLWDKAFYESQGFWHAGNTLDTYVTYLVQSKQSRDPSGLVEFAQRKFDLYWGGKLDEPDWWRDDYGWWGIAFLNVIENFASQLDPAVVAACTASANDCWQVMNTDWVKHRDDKGNPLGVRNNPKNGIANTITNVLFLVLAIRRYEVTKDKDALTTAGAVFDWFYHMPPPPSPPSPPGKNGLLNKNGLIRELVGQDDDWAWTGDQGWFLRACFLLSKYETDPDRLDHIKSLKDSLIASVESVLFVDDVVQDLPYQQNWDHNFATGPGVLLRQLAIVNAEDKDQAKRWTNKIRKSAEGAATYSGWDIDNVKPNGAWNIHDSPYSMKQMEAYGLWNLIIKTAAQDAFNAWMTVA